MKLNKSVKEIEKILNYSFRDINNLMSCIIHPSFYKDKKRINDKGNIHQFERLEFLGDRVLGIAIASLIFDKFKNLNEGNLTKKLSYLVQKDFLYKIALEISLDEILIYSYNKNNLRMNKSIFADSVESLIGSIFIDGGYRSAFKFIKDIWSPYLDVKESNLQDPKTQLQEISQQKLKTLPEYRLLKKAGPAHSPNFIVSLKALNMKEIIAEGKSKREAEKKAAKIILKLLSEK